MNKKLILRLSLTLIIATALAGCDGLSRSEFQNEYIKKCDAEGKYSNARCVCFAEKVDLQFDDKTKQLILNPSDNPFGLLALVSPLLTISDQCIAEGR